MSLKVWLPAKEDFKNYGPTPAPNVVGSFTTDTAGKIGTAMKSNNGAYVELPYSTILANTSSISFGGWFKINLSEIATIVNGLTYDSNKTYASGQFIGNSSYGGMALVWTSNRMLENPTLTTINCSCQLRTANGGAWQTNATTLEFDTWIHLFYVWNKNTKILSFYKNGELIHGYRLNKDFTDIVDRNLIINYSGTYGGNGPAVRIPFSFNDIRVYNEPLSEKEIHDLYNCLTIHYKLDEITDPIVNCYTCPPTFETDAASGGWNHWNRSGGAGTHGQNTDRNFIYFGTQTYSHWFAASGNDYLLYQSPEFTGGYRSFQCIVKEQNGRPITNDICYPAWNARDGGAQNNSWTDIIPLRDDFYLCQVNGLHQDGSDNLVGLYVKPDQKVYVSIMVLENGRAFCGELLYPKTYITDSSGYNHNGIINGNIDNNEYTPRNRFCTLFDGNTGAITVPFNKAIDNTKQLYSFSLWFFRDAFGSKNHETLFGGPSGFEIESKEGSNNNAIVKLWSWGQGSVSYQLNTWNHIVFTHGLTNSKLYLNGNLVLTGNRNATIPVGNYFLGCWRDASTQNYLGYMSDFRVYANELSANDAKQLYNTPMNIDSQSNIHCYDFVENSGNLFSRSFLTNSYGNKTTPAPHPQIWGDTSTGCLINSNGEIEFLGANGSIGSKYIKIKPGNYYYEIDVSIAAGNQFYIQYERYDLAKTARTNQAAINLLQVKPTTDLVHQYYSGTVDLSTDGTNPCDTVALRILNRWSGSESTTTGKATVHRFSVRLQTECKNPKVEQKDSKIDLNENKKAAFYNNGILESTNFIEK